MAAEDASARAQAAKEKGNAAFKEKDYETAIGHFTEAIEADPTNHVLYSNRSGAHAAKKAFTDALLDANKCIELNAAWAKGHSRRGAAYFGLKNWPQAQTAYEKALELDPSSTNIQTELENVKLQRNPAARAAAEAAGRAGRSGSAINPAAQKPAASAISLVVLLSGALYVLPLVPRYALLMYRVSIASTLVLFVHNLLTTFPIALATLTDPRFKACQESQAFMLCIFMLLSPPMPFALMPFLSLAFLNVCHAYGRAAAKLPGPVGPYVGGKMAYCTTDEGAMQVSAFGAVSEVIVAVMAPLLCVIQG
jgi:hypothetical protein